MGYGGFRTGGIAFFLRGIGLSQADNQVFNQLGKISGTLLVGKRNATELLVLSYPQQPIFDDTAATPPQYRGHSFLGRRDSKFTSEQLIVDEFGEFAGLEWFHDDI